MVDTLEIGAIDGEEICLADSPLTNLLCRIPTRQRKQCRTPGIARSCKARLAITPGDKSGTPGMALSKTSIREVFFDPLPSLLPVASCTPISCTAISTMRSRTPELA